MKTIFVSILLIQSLITCIQTNNYEINGESNGGAVDTSGGYCSPDDIIDRMADIFVPEDYEEGKDDIKTEFESFNETVLAINRLQEYSRNVSLKLSEFTERLNIKLIDVMVSFNVSSQCKSSLIRILKAVQNGERWAIKCKLILID